MGASRSLVVVDGSPHVAPQTSGGQRGERIRPRPVFGDETVSGLR